MSGSLILRYIIVHESNQIQNLLDNILRDASELEDVEDIESIREIEFITMTRSDGILLTRCELVLNTENYSLVENFESRLLEMESIIRVIKVYDSFKLSENQRLLTELYDLEMKIREMFSIIMYLQNIRFEWSRAKINKDFRENPERYKKMMMNEFFFIEFSDYKNIDEKKEIKLQDLLKIFESIDDISDLLPKIQDLLRPTLGLKDRFEELSRIPEAIGRLEKFRNAIAHNRYLSPEEIENFNKAKEIIEDVYDTYIEKFKNNEL